MARGYQTFNTIVLNCAVVEVIDHDSENDTPYLQAQAFVLVSGVSSYDEDMTYIQRVLMTVHDNHMVSVCDILEEYQLGRKGTPALGKAIANIVGNPAAFDEHDPAIITVKAVPVEPWMVKACKKVEQEITNKNSALRREMWMLFND